MDRLLQHIGKLCATLVLGLVILIGSAGNARAQFPAYGGGGVAVGWGGGYAYPGWGYGGGAYGFPGYGFPMAGYGYGYGVPAMGYGMGGYGMSGYGYGMGGYGMGGYGYGMGGYGMGGYGYGMGGYGYGMGGYGYGMGGYGYGYGYPGVYGGGYMPPMYGIGLTPLGTQSYMIETQLFGRRLHAIVKWRLGKTRLQRFHPARCARLSSRRRRCSSTLAGRSRNSRSSHPKPPGKGLS